MYIKLYIINFTYTASYKFDKLFIDMTIFEAISLTYRETDFFRFSNDLFILYMYFYLNDSPMTKICKLVMVYFGKSLFVVIWKSYDSVWLDLKNKGQSFERPNQLNTVI